MFKMLFNLIKLLAVVFLLGAVCLSFILTNVIKPSDWEEFRQKNSIVVVDKDGTKVVHDKKMRDLMDKMDESAEKYKSGAAKREAFYSNLLKLQEAIVDFSDIDKYQVKFFEKDKTPHISLELNSGPFWTDGQHVMFRGHEAISNDQTPHLTTDEKLNALYAEGADPLFLLNVDTGEVKEIGRVAHYGDVCFDQVSGRIGYPYKNARMRKGQPWQSIAKRGLFSDGKLNVESVSFSGIEGRQNDLVTELKFPTVDCSWIKDYTTIRSEDGRLYLEKNKDDGFDDTTHYIYESLEGKKKRIDFGFGKIQRHEVPSVKYDYISNTYVLSYRNKDLSYIVRWYNRGFDFIRELYLPKEIRGFAAFAKDGFIQGCSRTLEGDTKRGSQQQVSGKQELYLCYSDYSLHKKAIMRGIVRKFVVSPDGCRIFGYVSEHPEVSAEVGVPFLLDICAVQDKNTALEKLEGKN